jgi:putative spermidine/putrescine transport system ATP-binding protein/putrescine transport system ATP-binding protein
MLSPPNRLVVDLRNVTKRYGSVVAVDSLSFGVRSGECVSLLGPSGCGKTSTLRLIAGFEDWEAGIIEIGGMSMQGKRPYERNVGLVFQDYVLFPHMSVEDNIAYGLRRRGVAKAERVRRITAMLDLVKLRGYGSRYPRQLSGGEQQRVAIARALVTEPEVLLLDEPLSNLDAKLRVEVRTEIKEILRRVGITTIIVTHDQEEAMSMADKIVVLNKGRLMQEGVPDQIYNHPANRFTADFIGRMNWMVGTVVGRDRLDLGHQQVVSVAQLGADTGRTIEVGVRPERVQLHTEPPHHGGANVLPVAVRAMENLGSDIHYRVVTHGELQLVVVEKNAGRAMLALGDSAYVVFSPEHCIVLSDDRESRMARERSPA